MKDFKTKQQMMEGHYCWGGKAMKKAKGGYAEGGMRSESTQLARAKRDARDAYDDVYPSKPGKMLSKLTSPQDWEGDNSRLYETGKTLADTKKQTGEYKKGGYAEGGNWIAGATKNKGALHRSLGVPQGEKIPAKKLNAAMKSDNPTVAKRARLAKTLKSFHKG